MQHLLIKNNPSTSSQTGRPPAEGIPPSGLLFSFIQTSAAFLPPVFFNQYSISLLIHCSFRNPAYDIIFFSVLRYSCSDKNSAEGVSVSCRKNKQRLNVRYISERVQEELRYISSCPITAVVAPMGYGKTTAVNWYLEGACAHRKRRCAAHQHLFRQPGGILEARAERLLVCGAAVSCGIRLPDG